MGDDDGDAITARLKEFLEDVSFRFGVDSRCRLVEDPYARPTDSDSSQGDPLPLASRQANAAELFADLRVQSFIKVPDEFIHTCHREGTPDVFLCHLDPIWCAEGDRVSDRKFVAAELLGHQSEVGQSRRQSQIAGQPSIEEDFATGGRDYAEKGADEGGFSRSVGTH